MGRALCRGRALNPMVLDGCPFAPSALFSHFPREKSCPVVSPEERGAPQGNRMPSFSSTAPVDTLPHDHRLWGKTAATSTKPTPAMGFVGRGASQLPWTQRGWPEGSVLCCRLLSLSADQRSGQAPLSPAHSLEASTMLRLMWATGALIFPSCNSCPTSVTFLCITLTLPSWP